MKKSAAAAVCAAAAITVFTAGFFGIGWFMDVLHLLVGGLKDKKKRYLLPLKKKKRALIILPVGLFIGIGLVISLSAFLQNINQFVGLQLTNAVRNTPRSYFQSLYYSLTNLANTLSH